MSSYKIGLLVSIVSLLMLWAPGVAAENSQIVPGAITVFGEGTSSAPAEGANVVITIGTDSYMYEDPMTIEPDAEAMPTEIEISAIVDAMVAYGIPDENIEVMEQAFIGEWGPGTAGNPVNILVTVPDPTVDDLSGLLDVVRTTARDLGLFINNFSVMYTVEDCRGLRQEARADAVADARKEAEDQAAALDTTMGQVVASRDTTPMNMGYYQSNNCTITPVGTPYSTIYMASPFDPALPAEVTVFVTMEVSFEIP